MNELVSLKKVIKSLVLPQFPWIVDFEVISFGSPFKFEFKEVIVKYFVEPEEDGLFTVTEDVAKLEDLTKTVFKMINFDDVYSLGRVEIKVLEK